MRHLLNDSKITKVDSCVKFLHKIIDCKEKTTFKTLGNNHESRYCNQKYFKLLVLGGYSIEKSMIYSNVSCINLNKVGDVEAYLLMKIKRLLAKVVFLKGDIYVFDGWNDNDGCIKSVEKYLINSKTWSQVAEMADDRNSYCACAFIDKVYVIGGRKERDKTNSCLHFDTSDYS